LTGWERFASERSSSLTIEYEIEINFC